MDIKLVLWTITGGNDPSIMSLLERAVRLCVIVRWGGSSPEYDRITDHLDIDPPDYRGAWRAHLGIIEETTNDNR